MGAEAHGAVPQKCLCVPVCWACSVDVGRVWGGANNGDCVEHAEMMPPAERVLLWAAVWEGRAGLCAPGAAPVKRGTTSDGVLRSPPTFIDIQWLPVEALNDVTTPSIELQRWRLA